MCARCATDGSFLGTPGTDFGPDSAGSPIWCACAKTYEPKLYRQHCIQPTSTNIPTQQPLPTQLPKQQFIGIGSSKPDIPATQQPIQPVSSKAPTTHILKKIRIENIDNGIKGNQPLEITDNLIQALSQSIPWRLNELKDNESQAQRMVQITLFDQITYKTLTATVFLIAPTTNTNQSTPPQTKIDTLSYFLTHHPNENLNGNHLISQTIDTNKRISYYVKGDSPLFYELHTWDDQYIYLKEDRTLLAVPSMTFSDGRWMKRQMNVGETIEVGNSNLLQLYDQNLSNLKCIKRSSSKAVNTKGETLDTIINSGPFSYKITLEKHDPAYNLGGDLGIQDIIVLKYDYGDNFENFYYSKEWGWVKWEMYQKNNPNPTDIKVFNLLSKTGNQFPFINANIKASCLNAANNSDLKSQSIYQIFTNCFKEKANTSSCLDKNAVDFNKDGLVNEQDYKFFLQNSQ